MQIEVEFHGAAGEVTGSCYLLRAGDKALLIDMGMFQGEGAEEKNNRELGFAPGDLSGVVLTHAHLDHCGRLPLLVKNGFKHAVWCTPPTRELGELVLYDSAKIATGNADVSGGLAYYTEMDAAMILDKFRIANYGEQWVIDDRFKVEFTDAGHILGSASAVIEILEGGKTVKTVVFSGDIGNNPSPIVKPVQAPEKADTVIMESTYGNRLHKPRGEERATIIKAAAEVVKTGGTLLIPAFSLERTQELLYLFHQLKKDGSVAAKLPVFLDAPMGIRATEIFIKYSDYFNDKIKEEFEREDVFDFEGLEVTMKDRLSRKIGRERGAKVIIAGSGMMEGGRIVRHAVNELEKKSTILLFTGFQAEGTLGREIMEGATDVYANGRAVNVRAKIAETASMSAHADQTGLLTWLNEIKGVKRVLLTHGEEMERQTLKLNIEEKLPGVTVETPVFESKVRL